MAFVSYTDIEEALPSSHDRAKIIRKLEDMEDGLSSAYGLTFDSITASQTVTLHIDNQEYQSVFTFSPFVQNITSVTVKTLDSSSYSEVLTADEDYVVYSLANYSNIISLIETRRKIQKPCYLEVECDTGFLTSTPRLLKNAIIEYLIDYQDYLDKDRQVIQSSQTDESSVSYDTKRSVGFSGYDQNPLKYPKIVRAIDILLA